MEVIPKSEWVWMPHPGHFICGFDCRFHLNTKVGDFIVSTVGEYFPDGPVRDIIAESRGIKLKGKGDERKSDYLKKIGFEEIGAGRKYETMVFKVDHEQHGDCCPWRVGDFSELDVSGYNDPAEAYKGHLAMCEKFARGDVPST